MEFEVDGEHGLVLRLETYNSIAGAKEHWEVRLSPDLDLLIFKHVNNTWFNQSTVRAREGNKKLTDKIDVADYFLNTLQKEFSSLLHIKENASVRYDGSNQILRKLPSFLTINESLQADVFIGGKKYIPLLDFREKPLFVKLSVYKSIKNDNIALEIQDELVQMSLIRHKRNTFIWKMGSGGKEVFQVVKGNLGFLAQLCSDAILGLGKSTRIRHFTEKYVLSQFKSENFIEYMPGELIFEEEPLGPIRYKFSSTLQTNEFELWRLMHIIGQKNLDVQEKLIQSIEGVGPESVFTIRKNSDSKEWEIKWSAELLNKTPKMKAKQETLFEFLVNNADMLSGFELSIRLKQGIDSSRISDWATGIGFFYDCSVE
jgi:hypothetical protein